MKQKNLLRIDISARFTDNFEKMDQYCLYLQTSVDGGKTWRTVETAFVDMTTRPYCDDVIRPSCGFEIIRALEMLCDAGFSFIGFVSKSVKERLEDATSVFK